MMIGKRRDRWLALALLLACGGLARAQDAALAKDAELLAKPESNATVVANLKAAAPLTVLDRKGGWYRVRGPGGEEGWVKLLAVRLSAHAGTPPDRQDDESTGAASAALGGASSCSLGGAAAGAESSLEQLNTFEPSDDDMKAFEQGLDPGVEQPKQKAETTENPE